MLLIPGSVRVFVARDPIDMRRSFEGLSNQVKYVLRRDPLSGHVFVFLNRLRTHVKLFVWTRGGFTIVYKRLEQGEFALPRELATAEDVLEVDVGALSLLLEGLDARHVRARKRWSPSKLPSARTDNDGSVCE
ncbi:MAG: IS66 family insertion sequence element accessory protein TnpB [Deltaproteobacteria bacterium]|nr:IS66 family insertion sequence element accessory protein TnpB [Deltaproteobacteria bacterium]